MARTDKVILLTGDYAQRLDAIFAAANAALEDESPRTLSEGDPYADLSAEYKALKDEAEAEAEANDRIVPFAGIRRPKWRELKAKYPPRTTGAEGTIEGDRLAGINTDAAEDDIVFEAIKAWELTTGESVRFASSRAAFDEWADTLSEGEWQTLVVKAWELANGARFDPKSLPASRTQSTA